MSSRRARAWTALWTALTIAWAMTAAPAAEKAPIAIRAGSLIDCRTDECGSAIRDAVIIVQGELIEEAGPASRVRVPPGARTIDLSRSTVLPGLIDAHTHVLLQGDVTEKDYEDQILRESTPLRAIRATLAARA